MPIFSNLADKILQAKQNKSNKQEFKNLLLHIVSDGYISDAELNQINQLAQAYDIQEKDLLAINTDIYRHAFKAVLSDGIVTDQEEINLRDIANTLLVNPNNIASELAVLEKHRQFRLVQQGIFPIVQIQGLVLKKNETAHFIVPASLLEERVISQGYQGGSVGVNIRVAKGLSFRVGQSKGRLVKETGVIPVDSGSIVLTNQRIIYAGSKKSFNLLFDKLTGYQIYTNGMDFIPSTGNPKRLSIQQPYDSDMFLLILMVLLQTRP